MFVMMKCHLFSISVCFTCINHILSVFFLYKVLSNRLIICSHGCKVECLFFLIFWRVHSYWNCRKTLHVYGVNLLDWILMRWKVLSKFLLCVVGVVDVYDCLRLSDKSPTSVLSLSTLTMDVMISKISIMVPSSLFTSLFHIFIKSLSIFISFMLFKLIKCNKLWSNPLFNTIALAYATPFLFIVIWQYSLLKMVKNIIFSLSHSIIMYLVWKHLCILIRI